MISMMIMMMSIMIMRTRQFDIKKLAFVENIVATIVQKRATITTSSDNLKDKKLFSKKFPHEKRLTHYDKVYVPRPWHNQGCKKS